MRICGLNTSYQLGNTNLREHSSLQIFGNIPEKTAEEEEPIEIIDSNEKHFKILSTVYCHQYSLYLVSNDELSTNQLVIIKNSDPNNEPIFLNINGHNPLKIFGGLETSAAIDKSGKIIIITESIIADTSQQIESIILPNDEKALNIACCEKSVLAVTMSGRLYKADLNSPYEFTFVSELEGINIVLISGIHHHFLALSEDGRVFCQGENNYGQLGIGMQYQNSPKFTGVVSINSYYKFVSVSAGFDHSLFLTSNGKIFASGNNNDGQIFLTVGKSKNFIYHPILTKIVKNALFCVALHSISIVILVNDEFQQFDLKIQNFLDKMKRVQTCFLDFINNDVDCFKDLSELLVNEQINKNRYDLKIFLRFILKISNYSFRSPNFFEKIEKVLNFLKEEIKQTFTNFELFKIFKSNKRILLYLIEEKLIQIDESIYKKLSSNKYIDNNYLYYFYPELKEFFSKELLKKISINITEDFYEFRKKGENEKFYCHLIRQDSLDEFISFVNRTNLSLNTKIERSIYETNKLFNDNRNEFLKQYPELIHYAAFYGSVKIFNYLVSNKIKLDLSLWNYAIHGKNPEIIQTLEEKGPKIKLGGYGFYFIESIKCHHNEIALYILNNHFKSDEENSDKFVQPYFHFYNFAFIEKDHIKNISNFYHLCHYDYCTLVNLIVKSIDMFINRIDIYIHKYLMKEFLNLKILINVFYSMLLIKKILILLKFC